MSFNYVPGELFVHWKMDLVKTTKTATLKRGQPFWFSLGQMDYFAPVGKVKVLLPVAAD